MAKSSSSDQQAASPQTPSDLLSSIQKMEGANAQQYTVVKRDGTLVPFRRERIFYAIESAFRETKKAADPISDELKICVDEVTDKVVDEAFSLASQGSCLTVEGIQDIVELMLMKCGHHDVAKDYIIYRDKHKILREDSPQNLKIYREDHTLVRFNPMKIASAIEKAFRFSSKTEGPSTPEIIEAVNDLTQKVVSTAVSLSKVGTVLNVNMMEDEIEKHLMRDGFFEEAKHYILLRAGVAVETKKTGTSSTAKKEVRRFTILRADQSTYVLTEEDLLKKLSFACRDLKNVSAQELLESAIANFYEGIKDSEVDYSKIMAARAKIEIEPAYSTVASRLLLDLLYRETMGVSAADPSLSAEHKRYFKKYITQGINLDRLSPSLLEFDLDKLAKAMDLKRDDKFGYLGLQTLYDRYFIHDQQRRLETPQIFWMRVAMGLSTQEKDKNQRAIEFYNVLSKFEYMSSTPTLFNSGTRHPQLSSCYLSTVMDDLSHIFKVVADDAQLSKWAGGIGNDWTNVRATGSRIKGTNGMSQGVIPFLKVANDTAVAVNQCFAADTLLYTGKGIQPISEVKKGDVVLGISGRYREVTETFAYNQKDAMVSITPKHSLDPICVTSGHPFYGIRGVPTEQSNRRTLEGLSKGKYRPEWIEAGTLQSGDYIAMTLPQEVVPVPGMGEEEARLYGILLADGRLSKEGSQWEISGNPEVDEHLEFVRQYLKNRNIHFWVTGRGNSYMQIHWAVGRGAVRDATTGRIVASGEDALPFDQEDLYNAKREKHISPRFAHLPPKETLAMIQGLIETDGNVSRGKEISFTNASQTLVEGLRYQLLRLGVPTAGKLRVRNNSRTGKKSDGSLTHFKGATKSYDLRIPAVPEIAKRVGCKPITKHNWLRVENTLFTRVKKATSMAPTPFVYDLKVDGDESYMTTAGLAHNGGKRKGAMCAYLETWHLDIEDFLELRKNTGDDRRRTHDMNTANWIPDLFMKRVAENGYWTLLSPADAPDLHDLYGKAFEKRYEEYEKMAAEGKIKLFKKIEASQLWRKMLSMLFETGHPWITFKDPSNIRSSQDHAGIIHSSNLCTEILLNTSAEETAVCNLGSINLVEHMTDKGLDEKKLSATVRAAVRMLDNVVDINYYPTAEAKTSNLRHRPVGLGLMGFQDVLYMQGISYASHEAVEFADRSMEMISYYAILASSELAKERGTYSSYKGSKWDRGLLPIDTLDLAQEQRGGMFEVDRTTRMDWSVVRKAVAENGMRNSNTMAIAPTATISNITGVTQSIEPMYKHLFVKSNLSGEFTIPNTFLVDHLKKLGLWDHEMLDDLKYFDGSAVQIDRIPEEIRKVYLTAFEIDPEWMIECASRRQKWIDMGQSLNLYLAEPSGKKLHQMYMLAWMKGLKTTYYLRTLAATQIEKSTTDVNKRGIQPRWMKSKSASSNIQVQRDEAKPKACSLEEGCESCQ